MEGKIMNFLIEIILSSFLARLLMKRAAFVRGKAHHFLTAMQPLTNQFLAETKRQKKHQFCSAVKHRCFKLSRIVLVSISDIQIRENTRIQIRIRVSVDFFDCWIRRIQQG
ncbi:hypothetical protein ACOSQ2_006115 [Xanthoceras sorbifolium]